MALFVRQTEERSKLQERLAAELQERHKPVELDGGDANKNDIENSAYLKDTKSTSLPNAAWVAFILVALAVVGFFIFQATSK